MANSNFFGSLFDNQTSDVSLPADLSLPGAKSDTAKTEAPKTETRRPAKSDNWLPSSDLMPIFESSAKAFDVPVNVLMALGHQESRYNPSAVGTPTQWGRAKGIMQYLDDTAKGLGINPFDPSEAIPAAAKQIRERLNRGESLEDAVKEHFAGPDRKKWGEKTAAYGREVMEKVGKIGSMLGANTGEERAALQQKLDAEAPGRYKVLSDDEAATRFSPDTMDRGSYEHVFRLNNPGASQAAIDYALSEYDKNSAMRTAAAGNKVAKGFDAMQSPEATFDANLNKRLQGPANGIVPKLPGKMEQPAPVQDPGIPKDESFTDSVKRNAGYVGDNLKIGWNNLLNSFEGMRASEWGGLLDSMKRYYTPEQIAADPKLAKELADREAGYASSMASIAERNKENEALQARGRPETKQFFSAGGKPTMEQLATIGDALVKNPVGVISDLGVQSGPQSIAMMAAAILARYTGATPTGAAIAGGGTSAAIQFGSDYADLRAQGMPHDEAWKTAAAKAPVVGAFDALSFNSAGHALDKVLSASGKSGLKEAANDVGKKAGTVIAETGKQAGYGMAGEAGGSLASGRMPEPTDVIAEGVGEIFGAPGEALSVRTKRPAAPAQETPAAPVQPEAPVAPPPAPQSTVTPVHAEQSAASGPMSRAVENAAEQHAEQPPRAEVQTTSGRVAGFVESMQEDGKGGFEFKLQGDDGQTYTYTDKDGVQIAVEQKAPAGPMTDAVEKAAAEHSAEKASQPAQDVAIANDGETAQPVETKYPVRVERTAPPAEASIDLEAMTDDQLRGRLRYIASQAKGNGGWDKLLIAERKKVENEINRRQEAVRDEKPAADALRVRDDSAPRAPVSAQDQQGEPAGREAAAQPDRGGQAATGEAGAGAGTAVPGANAAADGQPALKDAHSGKWFASQEKADAYLAKKSIGETHTVVQTGKARFEVKPKEVDQVSVKNEAQDTTEPAAETRPADQEAVKIKPPKKLYRGEASANDREKRAGGAAWSVLGKGIYTTRDKKFAARFGKVVEVSSADAWPSNPLVIDNAAGGADSAVWNWIREKGLFSGRRSQFEDKHPDLGAFIQSLGYNGIIVGDEVVKYANTQEISSARLVDVNNGSVEQEVGARRAKEKVGGRNSAETSDSSDKGERGSVETAATEQAPAIDYSTRTDAQLASLAENANTEEKRAAARAEIERRKPSTSQPGESNASESVPAQPVESADPQAAEQPSDVAPRREVRRKRKESAKSVAAAEPQAEAENPEPAKEENPTAKESEPDALGLTPKQYHEAKLKWIAQRNDVPIAEVREMYGDEAGFKNDTDEWVKAVVAAAEDGKQLSRSTLDKLFEVRPNTRLPESAIPDGYQRAEARKSEAEEKQARIDARKEIKSKKRIAENQASSETPNADNGLESIFAGLESGKKKTKQQAEAQITGHPQEAQIRYVEEHWFDILSELEGAGLLKINC